jgi:putative chitinase
MITVDQLHAICPRTARARLEQFVDALNDAMAEFEINTRARQAAFLPEVAHETGGFVYLKELWGPTPEQQRYEPPGHKAETLGNTQSGDGFRYRGRGLIQITGRANYRDCGLALGLPLEDEPELLEHPIAACRSAAWFWKSHGLNALADAGDFERITRKINGGLNGQADRLALWETAKGLIA